LLVYDPVFDIAEAFLGEDAVLSFVNANGATQIKLGLNYHEGVDTVPHYNYGLPKAMKAITNLLTL